MALMGPPPADLQRWYSSTWDRDDDANANVNGAPIVPIPSPVPSLHSRLSSDVSPALLDLECAYLL
ncbi:unnamed protein product [Fusarium venenatum]|uniref:Uncharacterized protein n=1 Tax=Fusarium venenatum TaxID=56646 RepID=A0A2L2U2B4_9HYPO|nr:uncharacterized protein FVRRES_09757 [Fusarium venenatum]CEI69680.1 unnamed protein product [Fusarium venenatum]